PGLSNREPVLRGIPGGPEEMRQIRRFDGERGAAGAARGEAAGGLAKHGGELAVELPHAGLAGVVLDDPAHRAGGQADIAGTQPVFLELPRQEMPADDL